MKNAPGLVLSVVILTASAVCHADNWPQFRGPHRDGVSAERGLLQQWPERGPALLWSFEGLGKGFASVAVVDGVVYTTGMIEETGCLFAIDATGRLLWKTEYGPEWGKTYPGSRTTPTVEDDRIYIMSAHGQAACFERSNGDLVWKVDTQERFEGKNIRWGMAESVLIHGEKAICTPGGQDATMVALNKRTGETIWTTKGLSQRSAYCSVVAGRTDGTDVLVTLVEDHAIGVDSDTGKVLWDLAHETYNDISAVTPLIDGPHVYFTSQLIGGTQVTLSDGEKVWADKGLDCLQGGVVLVGETLFGSGAHNFWVCEDWKTGVIRFREKILDSKGSVIYADGRLYCYSEKGTFALMRLTEQGVEIVSSFTITMGTKEHFAHPALSDGRLYVRRGDALMVYDVREP